MATIKRKKRRRKKKYKTGIHISSKSLTECRFRSGWELLYMQWMDKNSDIVSYLYEGVIIPYVSNVRSGKTRKYYPDFLVEYKDGNKILVEIKPSRKLSQIIVKKKLAAAGVWCSEHGVTLEVITEHQLRSLHLL